MFFLHTINEKTQIILDKAMGADALMQHSDIFRWLIVINVDKQQILFT